MCRLPACSFVKMHTILLRRVAIDTELPILPSGGEECKRNKSPERTKYVSWMASTSVLNFQAPRAAICPRAMPNGRTLRSSALERPNQGNLFRRHSSRVERPLAEQRVSSRAHCAVMHADYASEYNCAQQRASSIPNAHDLIVQKPDRNKYLRISGLPARHQRVTKESFQPPFAGAPKNIQTALGSVKAKFAGRAKSPRWVRAAVTKTAS